MLYLILRFVFLSIMQLILSLSGLDSFLNSSAFAELAKDALNNSGNLDSRLSALNETDQSPLKTLPELSMSAVLEMEIKDVNSSKEEESDDDIIEIPQREFPARDSMERQLPSHKSGRSPTEIWEVSGRRRSSESRESSRMKESEEPRDKIESRRDSHDHAKPPSRWDVKESRSQKDTDSRRDNHEIISSSSSSSRRDAQEHKDTREEWDRDDHREYSSRERRSSRSSRESRDSHDTGTSEVRETYRSSSWDHAGSERESYSHKTRDRDYSLSHSSSYDSSLQLPKVRSI